MGKKTKENTYINPKKYLTKWGGQLFSQCQNYCRSLPQKQSKYSDKQYEFFLENLNSINTYRRMKNTNTYFSHDFLEEFY